MHHIETLSIYTPKGRRRIRRVLGIGPRMLNRADMTRARMRAKDNELKEGKRIADMDKEVRAQYNYQQDQHRKNGAR